MIKKAYLCGGCVPINTLFENVILNRYTYFIYLSVMSSDLKNGSVTVPSKEPRKANEPSLS